MSSKMDQSLPADIHVMDHHPGHHADGSFAQMPPLERRASISDNPFHKLILQPENIARTVADKRVGNPTPIALTGFLLSLSQQACDFMSWRGAGQSAATAVGPFVAFGGLLQFTGGLLEWYLGHTFPSVVYCSFGAFYLAVSANMIPFFNAVGAFAPAGEPAAAGAVTQAYNAGHAFYPLWMAVLCFVYMIMALRTNVCLVVIFFLLINGLTLHAAADFSLAADFIGNAEAARRLTVASGSVYFVAALVGWYVFLSVMMVSIDFPFRLPVGELGDIIRGYSERRTRVVARGPFQGTKLEV